MHLIRCIDVKVVERTRELDVEHKDEIKKDIIKNGLFHPLLLSDGEAARLVDGLHRLQSIKELHEEGEIILFDSNPLPVGQIPFLRFGDLSPERLLEAEIAANLFRKELSWQERTNALARLHRMQQAENPNATFLDTAKKLTGTTGKNEDTLRRAISQAIVLADAMESNPELSKARSETDAFTRVKSDVTRIGASLLSAGVASTNTLHRLIEGDSREILPNLPASSWDVILSDPPYGVGADSWTSKFQDAPHIYKDTWAYAQTIYATIFEHGMRLLKDRGDIFLFCDIVRWNELRTMAEDFGYSVWPRPVIWHKSNEGIRPWGIKGYAYCYEAIIYATKAQKGLIKTGPDVISGIYKVRDREHGAAKPPALYHNLIQSACLPGSHVLDPCCGSGTIFEAATLSQTIATGIEMDEHYIGVAQQALARSEQTPAATEQDELDSF